MKKIIAFLLIVFCCSSCNRLLLNHIIKEDVELEVLQHHMTGKTLAFVPMTHIAEPTFYEQVKFKVDSLRKDGFVIFYEGVSLSKDNKLDSLQKDTLKRKVRKLMGFHLGGGYKNKENKSLPKILRNTKKYVNQTDKNTGITKKDRRVDIPIDELIARYEKDKVEIKLTNCDWETALYEKYNCNDSYENDYVLMQLRNDYILERIRFSKQKKIALVYGSNHYKRMRYDLVSSGFKEIEEK